MEEKLAEKISSVVSKSIELQKEVLEKLEGTDVAKIENTITILEGLESNTDEIPSEINETREIILEVSEGLEDEELKSKLVEIIEMMEIKEGEPGSKTNQEQSNSEEVNKMDEELKNELESVKTELESSKSELEAKLSEVEELTSSVLAKDKELNEFKDELKTVTEAKDVAEEALAKIEQEKKDLLLSEFINTEVEIGLTKDEDRESRLESLRTLNDDALMVYEGMLSFQKEAADAGSAQRQTIENNDSDEDEEGKSDAELEKEEAIKTLEAAFRITSKEE